MRTKAAFAGLVVALAVPFIASAATVNDLQAQITSLLAQIQALEAQGSGNVSTSVSVSASMPANPNVIACPAFIRSLSFGASGSDVTQLQDYLQTQGDLSASATGYFGALTKAAVGKWQAQNGIAVSGSAGFGMFGPLSRSFYSSHNCIGGGSQTSQSFSADPQSGAAPLTVTFMTSTSASSTYTVDFGDGSSVEQLSQSSCAGTTCSYSLQHTYGSNGTYTAKLMRQQTFNCPAGLMCAQQSLTAFVLPAPQVVATTVVTVGSTTSTGTTLNFTASPTYGGVPLTVQFSASAPQGTNLGNTVNFGDGQSSQLLFVPTCSSCNEMATVSHTYASVGTYTAELTNNLCSCPANGICNCPNIPILATATVNVAATTATPTIVQLSAPGTATLGVNDIAEIRYGNYYFTLNSLTSSSATIQLTPVGCWNSFPSDTPPQIRCMIAMVPIPPVTLTVGQTATNYPITLTQINGASATFSVGASAQTTTVY